MNRPVHFEIHATDPERAIEFYKTIFNWTFQKWEGGNMEYWMVMTGEDKSADDGAPTWAGINGGLVRRMGPPPTVDGPVNGFVCTMMVESIDDSVASVVEHGGSIALPKMPVKGMGWLAYCKDTEGNIFGMMQGDENAE